MPDPGTRTAPGARSRLLSIRAFTLLKYTVYGLLCANVYFFLLRETAALEHTRGSAAALSGAELVQVFASTIDTAAWLLLLLLFELETAVFAGRDLSAAARAGLHALRALCGLAIVYAFIGYCGQLEGLLRAGPAGFGDACTRIGNGWSVLLRLNEYAVLDAVNCAPLGPQPLQLGNLPVLADEQTLAAARQLALTDVVNAGAWILVVLLLELEVRLQLHHRLSRALLRLARVLKLVLYSVLFLAAAYWGLRGDWLDGWDAGLWLFAFLFIELNLFGWEQAGWGKQEP